MSRIQYLEAEAEHSEVVVQRTKFNQEKEILEQVLVQAARAGMPGNLADIQKFY